VGYAAPGFPAACPAIGVRPAIIEARFNNLLKTLGNTLVFAGRKDSWRRTILVLNQGVNRCRRKSLLVVERVFSRLPCKKNQRTLAVLVASVVIRRRGIVQVGEITPEPQESAQIPSLSLSLSLSLSP